MSFVAPNIFDFVARKNDERYVHEKMLVQLFNDKRYSDILWKKLCPCEEYKLIKVIEQPMTERNSKSGHGFVDILLVGENDNGELLPVICELKTDTNASNHQLSDYYFSVKNNENFCTPGKQPYCFYITPDRRSYDSNAIKSDRCREILKKGREVQLISYKDLLSGIVVHQTSNVVNFDFVLEQYIKLVNEAEFCRISSIEYTEKNLELQKQLCRLLFINIKKKIKDNQINGLKISTNIDDIESNPYYYVDVSNSFTCLRFEIGYSSSNCIEDNTRLRILYGTNKDINHTLETANYENYLKRLHDEGKKVYYNGNIEYVSTYSKYMTQGKNDNHLNRNCWFFAQNLSWIAAEVTNENQIQDVVTRIADFILEDISEIKQS